MQDETLSINPNRETRTSQGLDPYVIRLPDGYVRVTAESIAFPETCPRCGSVPASVGVRLRGDGKGSHSITIPYCKRCGWSLNFIQYFFVAFLLVAMFVIFPHFKVPSFGWTAKLPSTVVLLAILLGASWVFEQLFKLFFKPRVSIIAWTKDSIDLSFEDQMYAEKFVELNR
jgi:hypothetical protein